jgi:hypothetical protein
MGELVKIESVSAEGEVLTIRCSGDFGYGSGGNQSGDLVEQTIKRWMTKNPKHQIKEIVLDLTNVEYEFGNAPQSAVSRFYLNGVERWKFIANAKNLAPLRSLVQCNPEFSVEEKSG